MTNSRERGITTDATTTDETSTTTSAALNTKDSAIYCGVSVPYLAKCRQRGGGPEFLRFGRSIRYLRTDLDQWLVRQRVSRLTTVRP